MTGGAPRLVGLLASVFLGISLLGDSIGVQAASPAHAGSVRVTSVATLRLDGALPSLTSLAFQDTETGYAGGRDLLLMTRDGGRAWQPVWRGQGTVTQIDPVSASEAYAVTTRGLLRTTDAGKHWQTRSEPLGATDCMAVPIGPCLAAVSFVASDPDVGYGVAARSPLVGTAPSATLAAPSGHLLYVANGQSGSTGTPGTGTVTAYNLASGRIAWDVPVGESPGSLALSADGAYLYVTDQSSNAVSVIDTRTKRVVRTVATVANPCATAIDPANGDVFVSSNTSGMDVLSPGPRSRVLGSVGDTPGGCSLAFGPGGKILYTVGQANGIQVVNPTSRKRIRTFDIAGTASGIAVSPSGRAIYVASTLPGSIAGRVLELRASTGATVRTWRVGSFPGAVTVDPATGAILVTSGSSVRSIDPGTGAMRRVRFVSNAGVGANLSLSLSPDGRTLYVPTGTGVTVVALPGMETRALPTSGVGVNSLFGTPALQTGGILVRTTDGGQNWEAVPGAPLVQTACALGSGGVLAVSGTRVLASIGRNAPLRLAFQARLQKWPGTLPMALCRGVHVTVQWTADNAGMEHAPYIVFNSSDGGRTFRPVAEENYTHIGLPGVNAPEGPGTEPGPFTLTPAGTPVLSDLVPGLGTTNIRPPDATGDASVPIPGAQNVLALSFPAEQVGYVLTAQGRILATADGGHHFTQLWPSQPSPLDAIAFPTAQVGYGLGTGGDANAVIKTVDAGRTWTVASNLPAAPNPYGGQELAFVNANLGYATSAKGVLYRTTDGGRHWTHLKQAAYQVAFVGPDGCAETGNGFSVSRDGGYAWQSQSGPVPVSLMGCAASLAVSGWSGQEAAFGTQATFVGAAGTGDAWFLENDRLYHTTDGGRTYQEFVQEALGTTAAPRMFSFPVTPAAPSPETGRVGYLLTQSGNLYRTVDGGRIWTDLTTPG